MPKFYCEYCGIYLTHSSPSGRKQHARGRKHIQNKIDYYAQFMLEQQGAFKAGGALAGNMNPMNPFMKMPVMPGLANGLNLPFQMPKAGGLPGMPNLMVNMPGILPTNITNLPFPNANQGMKAGGNPGQGGNNQSGFPGLQAGGIASGMGMPGMNMFDPSKMGNFPMGFPGMPGMGMPGNPNKGNEMQNEK